MSEPKYLYRYRPFNDFSKDILINNRLWFSSPTDFNDPFDCKVVFDKNNFSTQDLKRYAEVIYEHFKIRPSKIKNDDLRKLIQLSKKDFINHFKNQLNNPTSKLKLIDQLHQFLEFYHSHLKILCLSENNDDILMWSHYSKNHTGICLEFSYKTIQKTFGSYSKQVEYRYTYPTFYEANRIARRATYKDPYLFALLKSKHWEYEKEWRLIIGPQEEGFELNFINRYYEFPPEMLTGVIFGCEMKDDARKELRKLVQSNPKLSHVRFHEAKKKPNEFGLDIEEIK